MVSALSWFASGSVAVATVGCGVGAINAMRRYPTDRAGVVALVLFAAGMCSLVGVAVGLALQR